MSVGVSEFIKRECENTILHTCIVYQTVPSPRISIALARMIRISSDTEWSCVTLRQAEARVPFNGPRQIERKKEIRRVEDEIMGKYYKTG